MYILFEEEKNRFGGVGEWVVHCCTLSLCYLGAETDDHHRNPNIKNKDHLDHYVGD